MDKSRCIAAAGLTAAFIVSVTSSSSAETLIFSGWVPPTHVLSLQGVEPFMQCVKDGTNGEVDFNYFPSGQIASPTATLDAVNGGLAQVGMVGSAFLADKLPLNQITTLPGMGNSLVQITQAYRRMIDKGGAMAKEIEKNNIVPLAATFNPPYQLGLRGERIETLEGLKNKKIRVAGSGMVFAVNTLGAVPVQMPGNDAYLAVQQGVADGYFFALPSVESYSLQEVSKSISTNANFGNAQTFFAMDKATYDGLSPEKQKVVSECGRKIEASYAAYMDAYSKELEQKYAQAGVDMYEFSPEVLAGINEKLKLAADDYIKRMADLGLPGQEAFDEYSKALAQ